MKMLNLELNTSNDDKTKKKKQKLVKHKRKNWSKTDISEVERGIDELRKEQLTGYLFSFNDVKVFCNQYNLILKLLIVEL
jgi:hypothetical protein